MIVVDQHGNAIPVDTGQMNLDRNEVYETASQFFDLGGSAIMKLSVAAALDVCQQAAERGLVIARVEGGIWRHPGFEARVDCIWDGADPPVERKAAEENNTNAADFIRGELSEHDVFVLTAPPMTGWPHKQA